MTKGGVMVITTNINDTQLDSVSIVSGVTP